MKTLTFSILLIILISCEKEQPEPIKKGPELALSIKVWYRYDAMQLVTWTFENDTLVKFNRLDYKYLDNPRIADPYIYQTESFFNYKFKEDSLIIYLKLAIERFSYAINQDSMCFYMRGYLVQTYYSHKKYGKY